MHRAKWSAPAAVLLLLAACGTDSTSPTPGHLTLAGPTGTQWSGGTVTVHGTLLAGRDTLPLLVAGVDTLAVIRLDDTTAQITLPVVPAGTLTVTALDNGTLIDTVSIPVAGLLAERNATIPVLDHLIPAPGGAAPAVLGLTDYASGPVGLVDLTTGATALLPVAAPGDEWNVVPSYGGRYALRDSAQQVNAWTLYPSLARLDTASLAGAANSRQISQLAPGVSLHTSAHFSAIWTATDTTTWATEDPFGLVLSPAGNRAAVLAVAHSAVLDVQAGTVAYEIPGFGHAAGATFSDDGASFFVTGGEFSDHYKTLARMAASDGTELAHFTGDDALYSLAYDGLRHVVYALAARDSTPSVIVLDAETLVPIGRLGRARVGGCQPFPGLSTGCGYGTLVFDPGAKRLYAALPTYPGSETSILEFALP